MQVIEATKQYVKETLANQEASHDWWHIERVYQHALAIMEKEAAQADKEVVELAALLHDIADWKFTDGDESIGPELASKWLLSQNVAKEKVEHISHIIRHISFKGAAEKETITTIEGKIVQDADRLDAIGAIGIARTFSYGGYAGQAMFDPNLAPQLKQTKTQYKKRETTAVNHFFEKLLLLKDRMRTETGKEMAAERHQYMVDFLAKFLQENHYEDTMHQTLLKSYQAEK